MELLRVFPEVGLKYGLVKTAELDELHANMRAGGIFAAMPYVALPADLCCGMEGAFSARSLSLSPLR